MQTIGFASESAQRSDARSSEAPVAFGPARAFRALIVSVLAYAVIVACAFLLSRIGFSDRTSLVVVHVASAAGLLAFWRLGRWGRARFDSFGAALLLLAVAFRLQALIDASFFGARVEELYRYPGVPTPEDAFLLLLKAETITLAGLLLVACAWRLGVGRRVERHSFLLNVRAVPPQMPLFVYLAALGVDVSTRVLGVSFGALTQLSATLFMLGVASIYFVASRRGGRFGAVLVAVLMALPMTFLALNKGMKSEMFVPLLPAAALFWIGYRSLLLRGAFVVLAVVVLAVSQAYVHYVRDIAWGSDGIQRVSPIALIGGFLDGLPSIDPREALDSTSSRVNMTVSHAITVALADHNGHEPGNVFGPIPATFIPRLLWPGKPVLQPGAAHTARILGIDAPLEEIRSATAAGFSAELYLGGWWIGLVFGALAYGVLLAWAQGWALRRTPGFGHLSLCFLVAYWAFRFDENHVVYSYTTIPIVMGVLWLVHSIARTLGARPDIGVQHGGRWSKG